MKQLVLIAAASVSLLGSQLTGEVARPNVLFLAVDDLKDCTASRPIK